MKKIFLGITLTLLIISFLNVLKVFTQNSWPDFSVFYYSAHNAILHLNPYLLKSAFNDAFIYPPFCLLIFYPFVILPVSIASKLWIVISITCLVTAIWQLLKMYNATNDLIQVFIVGILVFNFFPVKFTLGSGQLNNLILLIITMAMVAINKRKGNIFGMLLGMSLTLKYYPLFILPYLLIRRKWKILLSTSLTIVVLFVISFLLLKPDIIFYFFSHVLFDISFSQQKYYYNQALSGFLLRDFNQLTTIQYYIVNATMSLAILAISLWIITRRASKTPRNENLEISIFITLNLLLNTFSWQHHFVLLLIPLLVTYFTLKQYKLKWYYYGMLAVCYLLTAINIKNPSAFFTLFQSHVFYGALGLWIFDLYLLQKFSNRDLTSER